MRTAGVIFRKLKEVKFRHLIVLYRKYLKRSPDNCRYNYRYKFIGENGSVHTIQLCLLHQDDLNLNAVDMLDERLRVIPHFIDVCQALEDCQNCNAFIPKYNRDNVKTIFEKELENRAIKEVKYPDICALEWVLERSDTKMPVISWIQALYFKAKTLLLKNKI